MKKSGEDTFKLWKCPRGERKGMGVTKQTFVCVVANPIFLKALQGFFYCNPPWELVHKRRGRIKKGVAKTLQTLKVPPRRAERDGRHEADIVCAVANPEEHRQMLTASFVQVGARKIHCTVMDGRHGAASKAAE